MAGTTSGVEPVSAFLRNVTVGTLIEYYEPGIEWLKARGYWTPQVRKVVEETGRPPHRHRPLLNTRIC